MKTRFFFDVEAQDLHRESFAFGYVVVQTDPSTNSLVILEKGECYSIVGAQGACEWVKNNVLPSLTLLHSYLANDITPLNKNILPPEIVLTTFDLRERFYQIYQKWKLKGVEFWVDVSFPVETNFLSAIVKDGQGSRDFEMPYPLHDASNFLDINISRIEYCGVPNLRRHNPIDDCIAIAYSLHKYEMEKLKFMRNENKIKLRFLFDVGAQDLHQAGFAFGYVVSSFDPNAGKVDILEKGECYSILGAQKAGEYVRTSAMPCLTILHPYLNHDEETLKQLILPNELVISIQDLRKRFWSVYSRWKRLGDEAWSSDVNYPVETNFLSAIVEDGNGNRDWKMPYPLSDVASFVDVDISRQEISRLNGLHKGNPLHHALTSSCTLHLYELNELQSPNPELAAGIRATYQAHIPRLSQVNQFWITQQSDGRKDEKALTHGAETTFKQISI